MSSLTGGVALAAVVALAVQGQPSASGDEDLTRIRRALSAPAKRLDLVDIEPDFRARVDERRSRLDGLLPPPQPMVPPPPGGLYQFEQRQLGNPWAGQPLVKVDVLPLIMGAIRHMRSAYRGHLERAARDLVIAELADFCAVNSCEGAAPVGGR
ncbi:MAG: hypothetical protein FJW27_06375 [Acidimicrobiia bacterium]|nr:hypothetical protein [Acidimicrobiia bacterium]